MSRIQEIEDACSRAEPIIAVDPVMAHAEFPLQRMFYPMGFPIEVTTNSQEILDIMARSWSAYKKRFDTQAIQVQVGVVEGGSPECPPTPSYRVQNGILSNIADPNNFGICDMVRGVSAVWVTQTTLAHLDYLRYCFLDAAVMCQLATRCVTAIHGACVERNGVGILLCGDSGAGKSTLSYACAQAGWTYITDDASYLVLGHDDRMVVGNCNQVRFRPSAVELFPELHGMEITQRAGGTGKPSIEFGTSPYQHINLAQHANVSYIVFLNRRDPSKHELLPYSKEVAGHFMRDGLFSTAEMQVLQNAAIDRLLEADVLELRYQDLGWAIERLEQLVQDGR